MVRPKKTGRDRFMLATFRTGIFVLAFACAAATSFAAADQTGSARVRPATTAGDLAAGSAGKGKLKGTAKGRTKETPKASKKTPAVRLSGSAELQVIYDDNILRANKGTLLEFRQNAAPEKFKIETYDDMIISPKLNVALASKLVAGHEGSVRLSFTRWQYARNPIKNNDAWAIRLRQQVLARDFIEASYTYAPSAYIRELSDRPPYTPRTVPIAWVPFKSARNAFTLGYSHRFTAKLIARADVGRTIRYYNRPFLENDNWEWNGVGVATYSILSFLRLNGRYAYANVKARAHDSTTETQEVSDDGDPSYERDLYELGVDFLPKGRLWNVTTVSVTGQYQGYYFTADRVPWEDGLHVGRKDTVKVIELGADTSPLFGPVGLSFGYRYTQRRSSLPADVGADAADEKDYNNNRFWVGAAYPF
jgi:hypothetical protein